MTTIEKWLLRMVDLGKQIIFVPDHIHGNRLK